MVWAWEGGLQFIQQADVPHFVERLGDVKPVRYVTKTWSVVLLNKTKHIYCYLKCIVYDKLLKPDNHFE